MMHTTGPAASPTIANAQLPQPPSNRFRRVPKALLGLALVLSGCSDGEPAALISEGLAYKHVLLITLDTTRADALGIYAGQRAKTPRIDKLARSGVLFQQATSAAPSTLASHTSIMTGLYPRRHGVARNSFKVSGDNVMLAEVLKDQGFHTAGFIGSFALAGLFNFNQGFDHWDQEFSIEVDGRTADQNQRPADQVTDSLLDYVANFDGSQRLFLFAHYFDVHAPYAPPEPFASQYMKQWPSSDFGLINNQITKHQKELIGTGRAVYNLGLTRGLLERANGNPLPGDDNLAALYAGELAFVDTQVGRLLDGLEERGILQDCVVVLMADHGETFWEHADFWHHGAWVYETNIHVPLMISLPDGRGRGRVVSEPVSTTDVYPTLLDLLGIEFPEAVAGRSLLAAIDGQALPNHAIFSEATQPTKLYETSSAWANQFKTKCVRYGHWKYIQTPYLKFEELYNLDKDPGERNNLTKALTPKQRTVLNNLRKRLKAWRLVEEPRDTRFDQAQLEGVLGRLKALGYTGNLGDLESSDPKPKESGAPNEKQ